MIGHAFLLSSSTNDSRVAQSSMRETGTSIDRPRGRLAGLEPSEIRGA